MNRRSVSDCPKVTAWILPILAISFLGLHSLDASPQARENSLSKDVASALSSIGRDKSRALVRIHCRDDAGEISGTGFLIDPAGTVCTVTDAVRGDSPLLVESEGKSLPASVLATDERTGIVFLRIAAASPAFIPPFPSATPGAREPLAALGSGSDTGPLLGVTGRRVDHDGVRFFPVPLTTATLPDAAGRPGTPVFDLSGKFAGVVVMAAHEGQPCAVLPAAAVEKLHGDLLRFGRPNPGWIGIIVEEAAVPEGSSRTRVAAVEPGSPAERAGIRPGDYLLTVGTRNIVMPQEVLEASFYLTAGRETPLVFSRSGEPRRLNLRCIPVPGSLSLTQH
jgi:serine protease Do